MNSDTDTDVLSLRDVALMRTHLRDFRTGSVPLHVVLGDYERLLGNVPDYGSCARLRRLAAVGVFVHEACMTWPPDADLLDAAAVLLGGGL